MVLFLVVLHPEPSQVEIPYTFAHVMSWSLQCAKAVNYLHQTKPRAIVHRDLKPPKYVIHFKRTKLSFNPSPLS